ncbi:MAG: ABC transporter permease [Armatimonadota bacterium]|nr:ABC transporter permease [Armatimonadota bacterium]
MTNKNLWWRNYLLPATVVAVAIAVWWLLSARGIFPPSQFPSPQEVAQGFGEEWRMGRLVNDIKASLLRVTVGFSLAVAGGVPLGLWLGHNALARAAFLPAINFFRSLSPLAWIGFAILWFGIGTKSAVFLVFMATFFPLVLATSAAVAQIPAVHFRVAQDYGLKGIAMLTKVTLPAILPQLITALRVTAGLAWVVLVAAELAGAQEGLGFAIHDARNGLRPDLLVVAMIIIGAIGVMLDRLLMLLTRIPSVRWGYDQ